MTAGDGEDWSSPSLYSGQGRIVEPRTFTEADPLSALLLADWASDSAEIAWSDTTYNGPRRKRPTAQSVAEIVGPRNDPAAEPVVAKADRGLLANSRTMAVASLVSRITGFLRSSLLVAAIGVGDVGDSYNLGNNLPNMLYELLLGGVLSSVLIPLLVRAQEDDADGGVRYTQRLLSIATAALGALTLIAVACAPLFAAGFVEPGAKRSIASLFATLLLPEIFFYGIGAMLMAVLNIRHSFRPGAWSPVLNNAVMIVTLVVFWTLPGPNTLTPSSMTTPQILVLGLGTTLGIAAQAVVLIPALRRTGFRWAWRFRAQPNERGRMKDVGKLSLWILGYVAASQIGVTVIAAVGVHHTGAFAVFTQADLLIQMPYGILVVSLLTALMPRLSRAAARGENDEVIADLGLGARLSSVTLLPITAGLIVLGQALTIVLFAYGQTSVDHARLIGTALAASAFGLFPFAIVMLQLRVFYAMRDGRTPTFINIFMVGTKVAIVLVCAQVFDNPAQIAVALTVATSASYVVGAVVGHIALTRRLGNLHFGSVLATVAKVGAAALLGAVAAWAAVVGCADGFGTGRVGAASGLVLGGLGGLVVLSVVLWRMRIPEIQDMLSMVRRR